MALHVCKSMHLIASVQIERLRFVRYAASGLPLDAFIANEVAQRRTGQRVMAEQHESHGSSMVELTYKSAVVDRRDNGS